jgi:lipoprotein-anchoring transpeptidase ErfK/SrfK
MGFIMLRRAFLSGLFLSPLALKAEARRVYLNHGQRVGSIIIETRQRALYFLETTTTAIRYDVAVGMAGKSWAGLSQIDGKHVRPAWSPPPIVKRDMPHLPEVIAGGAPNNPMGERALTLVGGEYAIHGTNRPDTVGRAASYGCFRMRNAEIIDLYDRVRVGAYVLVTA